MAWAFTGAFWDVLETVYVIPEFDGWEDVTLVGGSIIETCSVEGFCEAAGTEGGGGGSITDDRFCETADTEGGSIMDGCFCGAAGTEGGGTGDSFLVGVREWMGRFGAGSTII